MKKFTLTMILLLVMGVTGAEAQVKKGEKTNATAKQFESIASLREMLVEEEVKLNHEMFRIFLDEIACNIRTPFYYIINSCSDSILKNPELKKLYEEQKSIEKELEKFGQRDSMDRDFKTATVSLGDIMASRFVGVTTSMDNLNKNPQYRELNTKLFDVNKKLSERRAEYYILDKMEKGEYINFPVNEREKEKVMNHPALKKIAAQIKLIENMIQAKERALLTKEW